MPLFRRSSDLPAPQLVTDAAQDDAELVAVRATAVQTGAWEPAAALLGATSADPDRRGAVAHVLAEAAVDPAPWLDAWLAARPEDPGVQLVAAWAMVQRAFAVRGGGRADMVGEHAYAAFFRLLDDALPLCHQAVRSGGDDPTPWVPLLWLAVGREEARAAFDDRWAELVQRDPHNRLGHNVALQYLCEKWHGSHDDMYAFARSAGATPWAPVVALQAHIELRLDQAGKAGAPTAATFWGRPEVADDLDAAMDWARSGQAKHAYALHDLSVIGFCCDQAERWSDAYEIYALAGLRAYTYPWYYLGDPAKAFAAAHRAASKRVR